MILLDFSGVIFSSLYVELKDNKKPNKDYIRHLCLNTIRHYNAKFRNKFGELIVCYDSRSWRELSFPQYKWVRKNNREESEIDWDTIWELFSEIQQEITDNLPYRTVQALGAEADDVIALLSLEQGNHVIVSNDKDLVALTKKSNVKQFRPYDKEFLEVDSPERFEFDLVISGDKDDGIPNIKCVDWFYVHQELFKQCGHKPNRSPAITKKWKDELWELYKEKGIGGIPEEYLINFRRNEKLIKLDEQNIPKMVRDNVSLAFSAAKGNNIINTIRFMQENKMHLLSKYVDDFVVKRHNG